VFIPVFRYVKVIKIQQDFPELRLKMYCHLFYGSQRTYLWKLESNADMYNNTGLVMTWQAYCKCLCILVYHKRTLPHKLLWKTFLFSSNAICSTLQFRVKRHIQQSNTGCTSVWSCTVLPTDVQYITERYS